MEHLYRSDWSIKIQGKTFSGILAALLEGAGPARYLLSQGLLACLPLVGSRHGGKLEALAEMLEDPEETRAFADFLRGGNGS
jgi:hypothetical protein